MSDDWEDEEYDGTDEGTEDSEHDGDDVFGQESYDPDDLDDDAYEDAIEKVNGEAEAEWLRRGTDPTHPFYDPKKYDIVDFDVDKMFAAWAAEDEEEAEEQAALGENMMLEKMEIARVAREARLLPLPELHEVTFAISKKRKEMKKSLKKGWAVTKRALEPPFLRIVREQREHHERNRELDDNVRAFKKDLGAFVYEVNAMQRKAKGERTNRARKLARNRAKMDLEVTLKSKAKKGVSQGTITKMRQRRAKRRAEAAAKEEAARLEAAQQLAEDLSAQREHNIKMFSQIAKTAGAEAEALELAVIEDRAAMVEEKEAAQEAETALHNHQVRGFHKLGPAPLMATRDDVDRVAALEQGGVEPGWSRHDMADRLLPGGLGAAYAALPNASDDSADVEDDDVGSDDGFDRSEVTRLGRGIGSDAPNVLLAGDATRFAVERSSHDLQALEADLARMERAFGDLQFDQRAAAEEEECVQDRRVRMRNSRSEALEGETVLRKRLRGPPPRMPGDDEKFGSLYRSKKILRLTQLEKSLLKRSAAIARERRGLALQEVRVARDLAQLRERVTAAQRAHAELAAEERSLPMILGNSLSVSIPAGMTVGAAGAVSRLAKLNAATDAAALAPHGTSPTEGAEQELTVVVRVGKGEERGANKTMGAPPSEFRAPALAMEAVLMRSHLVLTTAAANDALELQTGIRKMDRRQWELRESNLQLESEVEHGLSRLAAIKVAMGKNEDDYRRVALVRSIQRFFACGIKLHHVNALLTTDLDWWGGRSKPAQPHPTIGTASSGGGVILRDGNRSGNLEGSIDFPRHSLWAVSFIVTKVDVKAPRQGQRLDHVVFSAGNSQSNVHHVCTVLNRRPAGNPYISHVITHQIRGAALHYRFDWDAASADESIHLVVRVGKCQEQHPIDLEEVCDVGTGKKWYVSSYVKLVRFEMSQGQGRFSLLLEELIRVEEAMREDPKGGAESFMESNILHGHAQLFKVSQLHHELQEALAREGAFQQKLRAAAEKELKAAKGKKARKADRKRQKIIAAKRRYMERKSANNNSVDVETLTEIVGETIEIYRERDRMWRTAVVADFKVSSADGGLSTQTLHLLEFVPNKATESGSPRRLETEVWLNLAIQKFQVMATAVIVLSPEAKRAQEKRERIAWERMERQKEEARVARDTEAARVIEEDETIARLIRDFNAAEKEALEEAPAQAEDDARHLMRLSPGKKSKEQIQVRKELKQAAFFMGQQTLQIAREAGDDDAEVDLLLANEEAREAFIAVKRREARLAEEAEWELRREIHESDIKELRAEQLAGRARRSGGAARQASKAAAATAARIAAERDALRERMRIDMSIWSKAMPTSAAKPIDLVTKKWTTKYAHGEKGRETGEELTTLHKQAAQKSGDVRPYAGYGVGGIRQRFNAYEAERQRVEKEAFDIEQVETAIYETGTLRGVEELRFRHGLAMDESALAITPNARARASESQATKAGSPGANGARRELSKEKEETQLGFPSWARYPQKPRIEEEVYDGHTVQIWAHADPENGKDAFAAEFHAMDPRAYLLQLSVEGQSVLQARVEQLRHRTRFREMMDIAGRVQSFAKRVEELTKTESCYAVLRRSVRSILVQRHRDIEALERDQVNVSNEHDLAEEMLRKRKEAKTASIRAASTLVAVESKYTTTKAAWETAEVDACQATYEAKELEGHVEQTLEWRFEAEKAEAKAHGLLADARAMVNAAEIRQDEAKWPILRWQFKFDDVVDTKFGRGRVVQYRASDEILVVALPWNGHFPFTKKDKKDAKPVFRVYLPVQSVIAREETRQATEHHAMEAAEAETRAWTKMELDAQTRARKGMEEEEVLQRKIKSVESLDLLADEDYQAQMMWAEQMALLDIKMPDRKAELLGIAFTEVTEAWAVRERERLDHRNEMRRQDLAQKMLPLIAEKKERDFKAENARVAAERIVKREAAAKRREEERVAALKQREREEAEFQEMLDTLPPSQRDKVADEHAVFLAEQKEEDDSAVAAIAAEVEAEAAAEAAEILERKRAEKAVRKAELKRKKLEENARRKEKELAKSEGRKAQKTIYEQRPDAPPVIGPWTQYKMRKAAIARMEEELVVAAKAKAADAIVEHWERRREAAREDVAMEEMWQQMLLEVVVEAAAEELALAEEERERAETRVGVVLTDTKAVESRMPYSVYRPLIRMRQSELAELAVLLRALGYEDQAAREERRRTEMIDRQTRARSEWLRRGYTWTYNMEKMETILLEEAEFKRREKKQERIALVTMRREEKATYMFLKEERVLFLQERRRMAEEEAYMRDFMRRWDQLHAASKYDVAGMDNEDKGPTQQSERRAWLKKRGAERKLMKRELEFMAKEDELAHEVRAEEQHELQLQMLRMEEAAGDAHDVWEFEDTDMDLEDMSEEEDSGAEDFDTAAVEAAEDAMMKARGYVAGDETRDVGEFQWIRERNRRLNSKIVELPPINAALDPEAPPAQKDEETLTLVTPWTASLAQRVRALQRLFLMLKYKLNMRRKQGAVENVLEALEDNARESALSAKMIVEDAVEVALARRAQLLADERVWSLERNHLRAHNVVTRLIAHGQSVGAAQRHAFDVARRRRLAEKTLFQETFVAIDQFADAKSHAKEMDHIWRLVEAETRYFDSAALHMFDQRMKTQDAANKLYYLYFELITQQVRSRAEITVNERRMRVLDAKSQETAEEKRAKTIELNRVRRERVQFELMCLRRSVLGERMFAKSRAKTLKRAFAGWREAWRWRLNIRSAFDLRAKLAEQSLAAREPKPSELADLRPPSPAQSIMRRHQLKQLRCTHCKQPYQEATNHGEACAFHPGKFTFLCPRACPHHKGQPAPTCMAHFRARWSCCDKSKNPPHDANGCQRRWHRPAPDDEYRSNTDRAFMAKEDGDSRQVAVEREVLAAEVGSRQVQLREVSLISRRLEEDRKTAERWTKEIGSSP